MSWQDARAAKSVLDNSTVVLSGGRQRVVNSGQEVLLLRRGGRLGSQELNLVLVLVARVGDFMTAGGWRG